MIQATGAPDNNRRIIDWTRDSRTPATMDCNGDDERQLSLACLGGAAWVRPGDWITQTAPDVFIVIQNRGIAMNNTPPRTTVRRSWPIGDADEVETIKAALERLEIPYILSFDTKRDDYYSWEFTATLTGDPVDLPPPIVVTPE